MRASKVYAKRGRRLRQTNLAENYQAYLRSDLWQFIRERVLKRDGRICRICGNSATQAHHTNYSARTLSGESIMGLFAICGDCHKFIEWNQDGTKAHLMKQVRRRIHLLAKIKGRTFIWPSSEKRPCVQCVRIVGLPSLDDAGRCARCIRWNLTYTPKCQK